MCWRFSNAGARKGSAKVKSTGEILHEIYATRSPMNTGISSNGDPPPPDEPGGGKPDCPHCGGLGFVVPDVGPEHPSFGRAVPCSCRAAELEARRHEQLMRFSQLGGLAESTFDNFIPEGHGLNEARRRNLRIAYETARAYAEEPEGWLVLKGGYGCGKT